MMNGSIKLDRIRLDTLKKNINISNMTISTIIRDGSRADATSKMERFVIIVNGCKPLPIITEHSILDVAAALDPPLIIITL